MVRGGKRRTRIWTHDVSLAFTVTGNMAFWVFSMTGFIWRYPIPIAMMMEDAGE